MSFEFILKVITQFYAKATDDILIGFHFSIIKDFEAHLPRIASFWQLQLTGQTQRPTDLPFELIKVHKKMKLTKGQLDRWVFLFHETLSEFQNSGELRPHEQYLWMGKLKNFRDKMHKQVIINP